ncbi:uncharacterized protein LOC117289027 isoform X1 [Asterias rubens]|uniref:uncharacterized protein LOC117289027 isoform X1 n=1 Tax=Asterias rubens TaxID=7604 RepID=UPI00145574C7|nr:uncharacterized protein LOC117289027 isoform X1 [Asterias rubens]
METNQEVINVDEAQQNAALGQFLAMLGEDNMPYGFQNDIAAVAEAGIIETPSVQNDDDCCDMVLAMSPPDLSQQQMASQIEMSVHLEVLQNMLKQAEVEMQSSPTYPAQSMDAMYLQPSAQSPHMYEAQNHQDFSNLLQEEMPQAVPVQNPSAMISGVVPVNNMIGTIDQSQLQDISSEQPMTVDPVVPQQENEPQESSPPARADLKKDKEGHASNKEEVPALPDYRELLIRIRYRSQEVVREHIKNPHGCLVYYNKPWQFNTDGAFPAGVEFPNITDDQRTEMTDSQYKFTDHVLQALEKGLLLQCDDYGNIYATRYCRSKIFWCSTEKGPIADSQMSNLTLQKLERNQPVMVFDSSLFQQRLLHYVVNKPTFKHEAGKLPKNRHKIPVSPAVFFTFAQSWNPMNSALSSCLVSMVVNPVRARMQRQWGNEDMHESYDISNYRLQISSDMIAASSAGK